MPPFETLSLPVGHHNLFQPLGHYDEVRGIVFSPMIILQDTLLELTLFEPFRAEQTSPNQTNTSGTLEVLLETFSE